MSLLSFTDILLWLQQHAASADSLRALPYCRRSSFSSSCSIGRARSRNTFSCNRCRARSGYKFSPSFSYSRVSRSLSLCYTFYFGHVTSLQPLTDAAIEIDADPSEAPRSHRSHHDPSHHHGHSINWHSLTTNIWRASRLPWYLYRYWHDPFPTTKQPYPWQIALSFLRFVNIFLTDTQLAWRQHTEFTRCVLFSFHITDNSFKPLRRLAPLRVNLLNLTFR